MTRKEKTFNGYSRQYRSTKKILIEQSIDCASSGDGFRTSPVDTKGLVGSGDCATYAILLHQTSDDWLS